MSRHRRPPAVPSRRFRPLVVAAIAVGLLVATAFVVARTAEPPSAGPAPVGASPSRSVEPDDGAANAGVEPNPVPFAWPADLSWVTVAGLDLPVSHSAGPRQLVGGLADGFDHTPTGAVLAALHLLVRTSPQVGPRVWTPTLARQVTGPDLPAFAEAIQTGYESARQQRGVPPGEPLGPIYASIAGVRVDAYQPHAASLRVLIEAPVDGGAVARAATVVQVSWSGMDWHLIAPPAGDWSRARTLLPPGSVSGYTPLPRR